MKKALLLTIIGFCLSAICAVSAPLQRDLGRGLSYLRVQTLPDDLPFQSKAPAIVLDLRYATGNSIGLKAWIETHASPNTPVFILTNTSTQPSLRQSIQHISGALILGSNSGNTPPDITIGITDKQERRAYDALSLVTDVTTLIQPSTEKTRLDEAAIVRAKNGGGHYEQTGSVEDTDRAKAHKDAPLIDRALQRAVHIHRGWLVLRAR